MALPGIMSPKQRQEKEKMKEGTVSVYDHSPQYQISQDRNALRAKKVGCNGNAPLLYKIKTKIHKYAD